MRAKVTGIAVLILAVFACPELSWAETSKDSRSTKSPRAQAKGSLHRADFRVEGSSCVACIRRVAQALKEHKGVLKADVSIFKPNWALVIYDAKQTTFDKIELSVKAKEANVRFAEVEDKSIAEMPVLVMPKGLSAGATPALKP